MIVAEALLLKSLFLKSEFLALYFDSLEQKITIQIYQLQKIMQPLRFPFCLIIFSLAIGAILLLQFSSSSEDDFALSQMDFVLRQVGRTTQSQMGPESVKNYMMDVDWTLSTPIEYDERASKWIKNCLFVIEDAKDSKHTMFRLHDTKLGVLNVSLDSSNLLDFNLGHFEGRPFGCPLFQVILDAAFDLTNLSIDSVVPRLSVSNISLLTTTSSFRQLMRSVPISFFRNRQLFAHKAGLTHFLLIDYPSGAARIKSTHFLKVVGAYLALRHSQFVFYTDTDTVFPKGVSEKASENLNLFLPQDFTDFRGDVEIVFGAVPQSWINSGVFICRRSNWMIQFLRDWYQLGRPELEIYKDQVGLWHVLFTRWQSKIRNESITYTDEMVRPLDSVQEMFVERTVNSQKGIRRKQTGDLLDEWTIYMSASYLVRKQVFAHFFSAWFQQQLNPLIDVPLRSGKYPFVWIHSNTVSKDPEKRMIFHCMLCRKKQSSFVVHSGAEFAYTVLSRLRGLPYRLSDV